jgi:glucosamine kinase
MKPHSLQTPALARGRVVADVSVRPVLGLDIGATWTRALAVDTSGVRLGSGRAGGANPIAHGVATAAEHIASAVEQALAGADAGSVAACVVGMAGASKVAADPAAAAQFDELWREAGLRCDVEIVGDVTAAFAAGCAEPDGSVLLAGTGAIAAMVADRRLAELRRGHGWLLGDEGSGFWIGRQAARVALIALDDHQPIKGLAAAVLDAYRIRSADSPTPGGAPSPEHAPAPAPAPVSSAGRPQRDLQPSPDRLFASALIAAVNARPPTELAALVPLVASCAEQGDPAATRILHEAADLLVATLGYARPPDDASPIVLAGGVLSPGTLVHQLVLAAVSESWPKASVTTARDGAAGAAWLAALHALGDGPAARELHSVLMPDLDPAPDSDPAPGA